MASQMAVFILEDDASVRAALKRLIGFRGYSVHTFRTLACLEAQLPLPSNSCVLADIVLETGTTLPLPEILTHQRCTAPIIFMTASDDPVLVEAATATGAITCLKKPFEADALIAALEAAHETIIHATP